MLTVTRWMSEQWLSAKRWPLEQRLSVMVGWREDGTAVEDGGRTTLRMEGGWKWRRTLRMEAGMN